MDNIEDVTRLPDDFDGKVRLFPLPELVMFPHAMQPLHIFEPRYCEMLGESLASDNLIAMATIANQSVTASVSLTASPEIASTVCIGRIISHSELEGDRHNILLVGIQRAQIRQELETVRPFRIAEVDVHGDIYPPNGASHRQALKVDLLDAFASVIPRSQKSAESLHELMAGQMGLGPITDIISYTLPFAVKEKLSLLAMADVDLRAQQLVALLRSGSVQLHSTSDEEQACDIDNESGNSGEGDTFPPPFSLN